MTKTHTFVSHTGWTESILGLISNGTENYFQGAGWGQYSAYGDYNYYPGQQIGGWQPQSGQGDAGQMAQYPAAYNAGFNGYSSAGYGGDAPAASYGYPAAPQGGFQGGFGDPNQANAYGQWGGNWVPSEQATQQSRLPNQTNTANRPGAASTPRTGNSGYRGR